MWRGFDEHTETSLDISDIGECAMGMGEEWAAPIEGFGGAGDMQRGDWTSGLMGKGSRGDVEGAGGCCICNTAVGGGVTARCGRGVRIWGGGGVVGLRTGEVWRG